MKKKIHNKSAKRNQTSVSWNLKLLYNNLNDPHIEHDIRAAEHAYHYFAQKYEHASYTKNPHELSRALAEYEQLVREFGSGKPWWYYALAGDLDTQNDTIRARATRIQQRLTTATNAIIFFTLRIGEIPKKNQEMFLKHPALARYHYFLKKIFLEAQHQLSPPEEQLGRILEQPAYDMWIDGQEKLLAQQTIRYKNKTIGISEAVNILSSLPTTPRQKLHTRIQQTLRSISHFAESELNAIYTYKYLMDTRRRFVHPYSDILMGFETSEQNALRVADIITQHFHIAHRFYRLHAKLIGKKLTMADRTVSIGKIQKKFSFDTAAAIVEKTFTTIHPEYGEIFRTFMTHNQIDAFPRIGKRGGAYCWGSGENSTFVLLNHTNDMRSVETLGHEMGHAIHTELSKQQPPLYQKYSTLTAEVASTFFEQAVSAQLAKNLSPNEQLAFLHNKLLGDISTIFRQIACFNFEVELHTTLRTHGYIAKETIAKIMHKHLQAYVGPAIHVTEDDGYYFVYWSHIRRFFYVYAYAYGQLVSRSLYEQWKEDPSYEKKIRSFLSAGKSMSPDDIFKSIGIKTSDKTFFEEGLHAIEQDVIQLEKLARKLKRI